MTRALIATVFNEAAGVTAWAAALRAQTVSPDEFVIVAGGRNLAILSTSADIIAANDAGSYPEPEWFGEITSPLLADPKLDVVGGDSVPMLQNDFQKLVQQLSPE